EIQISSKPHSATFPQIPNQRHTQTQFFFLPTSVIPKKLQSFAVILARMKQPVFSSTSWSRIHRREGNSNTSNSSTKKKKEGREEQGNSSGSNNRNPFQDLSNGGSFTDVNSSIVTVGSSSSSVSSIEAPKGCLRVYEHKP
ncbi:unnamed protein product, partial [Linum tenue]